MLIKVILIVAMAVIAALLLRSSQGVRHQAIRRLLLLLFGVVSVGSVLAPNVWNSAANGVGVGRGTDLLLYGLIVAFMGYTVTSYMRFRALEGQITRLARRLAIDEALTSSPLVAAPPGQQNATGGEVPT